MINWEDEVNQIPDQIQTCLNKIDMRENRNVIDRAIIVYQIATETGHKIGVATSDCTIIEAFGLLEMAKTTMFFDNLNSNE